MQVVSEDQPQTQAQRSRTVIDALEPEGTPSRDLSFSWVLPDGREVVKTYTQGELGMFGVQEFVTIITEVVNSFIDGDMGIQIGEFFRGEVSMPTDFNAETVDGVVSENIQLIRAFVQIVQKLPEVQLDILTLSLGVPRRERPWAKEQMQEPPHRGGLTVDQAFDLLTVFLRQNHKLIRETFTGKARELVDVFRLEVLEIEPATVEETSPEEDFSMDTSSPGSMPSSTFSPDTPESV